MATSSALNVLFLGPDADLILLNIILCSLINTFGVSTFCLGWVVLTVVSGLSVASGFLHFLLWDSLFQPKQPLSTMKLHFAWTRHGFSSPQLTRPIFVKLFWHWPKGNLWCRWFSVPVDHVGVVGLAVQAPLHKQGDHAHVDSPTLSSLLFVSMAKPVLVALTMKLIPHLALPLVMLWCFLRASGNNVNNVGWPSILRLHRRRRSLAGQLGMVLVSMETKPPVVRFFKKTLWRLPMASCLWARRSKWREKSRIRSDCCDQWSETLQARNDYWPCPWSSRPVGDWWGRRSTCERKVMK